MQIVHGHMKNPTLRFSGLCHQPGRQVVFPHGAKRAIPEQPHSGSAACRKKCLQAHLQALLFTEQAPLWGTPSVSMHRISCPNTGSCLGYS